MSNSLLSLSEKTKYPGIYKKQTKNGIAFIARYTVGKKTRTQIIGYEKDGATEYEAYKIRLNLISSIQLNIAIEKDKTNLFLIPKLFKDFMEYRKPLLAKNTRDNYASIYNQYVFKDFENKDIRNVTYSDLQNYINKLLSHKRPATVDKIVSAFRKFYKYLQDEGIYKYNPASKLIMPRYDNKKYFTISRNELNKIVTYIKNMDSLLYKTMYLILFQGRRIDETRTLKWTNIDFKNKIYFLDYDKTKTKKNQYYYLEEFQIQHLHKLKETNPSSIFVFENPSTKKPITYTSFFRIHKKLRIELNLPNYTIHCIRHTVAHEIVNNGYSLEIVAKLLGHSDIKTSSRYAVLDMNKAKNAYEKTIGKMFT